MPLLIPNDTMVNVFPNLLISATEVSETCSSRVSQRSIFFLSSLSQHTISLCQSNDLCSTLQNSRLKGCSKAPFFLSSVFCVVGWLLFNIKNIAVLCPCSQYGSTADGVSQRCKHTDRNRGRTERKQLSSMLLPNVSSYSPGHEQHAANLDYRNKTLYFRHRED